jgi:hypothetical protein
LERKNEMKNIGKYNGIPCYECTNVEWKDAYDRGSDNGKQIFIIDGIMVRNNKIVGHYDGTHVRDRYDEQPYFVEMWKTETAHEVSSTTGDEETVSYEEVVAKEICFSDYSRVVDEFFALLEK